MFSCRRCRNHFSLYRCEPVGVLGFRHFESIRLFDTSYDGVDGPEENLFMVNTPKKLGRLSRKLRSRRPTESTEVGQRRLSDGTVLERCIWMTRQEIEQTTSSTARPQLLIHWHSQESACVQDLPDLREIHLFWAHHVDYVAICWDRVSETPPTPSEVAATVDAWHRDYGLTWKA